MSSASSRGLAVQRSGGALLLLAALAGGGSAAEGGHPRRVERGNAVQERLLLEETLEAYERAENSGQVGDLLLLFTEAGQGITGVLTREVVATEIVRALVGSVGLVASVPLSTWLAAVVVSGDGH